MPRIRSVAVFCGAQPGHDPAHLAAANALGTALARHDMRLVFGGGEIGLMGAVADAALQAGGHVTGVIPEFLTKFEVAHAGVRDMIVTQDMHTRKAIMFDRADAFVIMPGGLGTLDEAAEIITWRQLGLHDKPILICDIAGWARPLADLLDAYITGGFARPATRRLYQFVPDVPAVMRILQTSDPAPDSATHLA